MIQKRRTSEKREERQDLFSNLLDASDYDVDGRLILTDEELLGQSFTQLHLREPALMEHHSGYLHFHARRYVITSQLCF